MYKSAVFLIIIFSAPSFAGSKCQYEWNALKKVQAQLRHQSTQRLRNLEHKKNRKYQDCRKGKKKTKTYNRKGKKTNLENMFYGKKQKQWLKYYKTPQNCKKPSTERKLQECIRQRDKKASHFERVWNSKQR
jgi:hypothetical protein